MGGSEQPFIDGCLVSDSKTQLLEGLWASYLVIATSLVDTVHNLTAIRYSDDISIRCRASWRDADIGEIHCWIRGHFQVRGCTSRPRNHFVANINLGGQRFYGYRKRHSD